MSSLIVDKMRLLRNTDLKAIVFCVDFHEVKVGVARDAPPISTPFMD